MFTDHRIEHADNLSRKKMKANEMKKKKLRLTNKQSWKRKGKTWKEIEEVSKRVVWFSYGAPYSWNLDRLFFMFLWVHRYLLASKAHDPTSSSTECFSIRPFFTYWLTKLVNIVEFRLFFFDLSAADGNLIVFFSIN